MRASTNRDKTQTLSTHATQRIETAAVYAALFLIAAIVFGTMSVHPF